MLTDRDISAIASYDRSEAPDPGRSNGKPSPWHCTVCEAHGRGVMAQADHWRETAHMCRFGERPWAEPAPDQPDFKGGVIKMFLVHHGSRDRSTVSEATVRALGIAVRK